MSDITPPPPPTDPATEVGTGADLAWLLATGAVRGKRIETPALMLTGVAGVVSGSLVPVTFPSAGGGGYTVSLPWINEPPASGDNVLVAHIGQARIVLGPFLKPEDPVDDDSEMEADIVDLETAVAALTAGEANDMYVVGGGVQAFGWTGGIVSKTADAFGNCTILFGEPGTPFTYPNTVITAWCNGASGGAPIAVNVSVPGTWDRLDLHLSGLEGTVVPLNGFSLIYGVLGF